MEYVDWQSRCEERGKKNVWGRECLDPLMAGNIFDFYSSLSFQIDKYTPKYIVNRSINV